MRDPLDIHSLWQQRRADMAPLTRRMMDVAAHYHDDIALPLPELDENEQYSVPNLIAQGIDQFSMRVAGVLPDMIWPPLNPQQTRSVQKATDRRKAVFGWWEASDMKLAMRQRARWLIAYSASPVKVVPDYDRGVPRYVPINPALALPSYKSERYRVDLDDCIFTYRWTIRQLREKYGVTFQLRHGRNMVACTDDTLIDCIEYLDAEQWTLLALGPVQGHMLLDDNPYSSRRAAGISAVTRLGTTSNGQEMLLLEDTMHDLGICPVSMPGRFGLERSSGQMDSLLGMRALQARLTALEILAVERSIFPNEWAVLDPSGQSQVIKLADGRAGIVGEIRGGQMVTTNMTPGMQTSNTINYLERGQRLNGMIPADFGGESATNIRTGRRGDQVLAATVDESIREHHDLLAASMTHENKIAVAWAKKHMGSRKTSFYVSWRGVQGQLEYTANDLFETDNNIVSYAQAGADISQLIVNSAQMQGTDLISQDTSRRMNPLIDDPDYEKQQVMAEKLERAGMAAFEQALASGQVALDDWAFVYEKVIKDGLVFHDALLAAQKRAQERQASAGPEGAPDGPVAPGAPEAQPGLAAGSPAEAGAVAPETVPQQDGSQTNLAGLLRALATTSRAANAG